MRTTDAPEAPSPRARPLVAVCRTAREAALAAAELHEAGLEPRNISIIANDAPAREAAAGIACWRDLRWSWVTMGCLNAIGAGLEGLGLPREDIRRCRGALRRGRILIVAQGTRAAADRPSQGALRRRLIAAGP